MFVSTCDQNLFRFGTHPHSEMPRRPRPAHRAPPSQMQKSNHRAPPLSTKKAKIVSKVQLQVRKPNPKSSKVTLEESSSSEDFEQGSREKEEDEPGTRYTLKRTRENEDEDEDEEVDAETDIDADADAPRVVQWLDDEDVAPYELKQNIADEVRLYSCS